jgi:hypothetical protein
MKMRRSMNMTAIGRFLLANLLFAVGLAGCGGDPVALESASTHGQIIINSSGSSDRQLAHLNTSSEDGKVAVPLRDLPAEALSAEMRAAIEANADFQKLRAQLKGDGDIISIDKGALYRDGQRFGVVFPIEHIASGAGEYTSIIYQEASGHLAMVSLELVDPATSEDLHEGLGRRPELKISRDGRPTEPMGYTCGGWGGWYTISTYCAWHPMCLGDATMLVRERARTCCATSCWTEYEHTTVRNKCGC